MTEQTVDPPTISPALKQETTQSQDDFSRAPVSDANLRPWWYLLIIETGALISIPLFVIGGQLGHGLKLSDLVLSIFCGAAILGIIGGLTARLGAKSRCSTALLARAIFGRRGAMCIGLLLGLGMTGWWGVQTEMFADAVVGLVKQLFHADISREATIAAGGAAMITTAALGIRAIGRLAYLAVPLLAAGLCYAISSLMAIGGLETAYAYRPPAASALGFGAAVATVAGGWIVGATMNPDIARFARNERHAVGYALTHYTFNYPLLLIICGVMAIGFRTNDLLIHLVPPGLGWLLLVLMMIATWAANDCNLYSSSLGLTAVVPSVKRSHLAIVAGIIGISLAELHLAQHMVSFLVLLGVVIAPIGGIFIIIGIDPRDPLDKTRLAAVPEWRVATIISWLGGAIIGYLATPQEAFGLGALKLTTIPTIDSVIAAALIMCAFKAWQKSSAKLSPQEVNVPENN